MVCNVCETEEIFKGDKPICPKCNKLTILSKETALLIVNKQVEWFNRAFYDVLKTFQKKRLIIWLLGEREKIATTFFIDKPKIQLNVFLAVNILIKRAMKDGNDFGEKEADEKNTQQLINLFSTFVNVAERHHIINEGFGYYIQEKDLEIEKLDPKTTLMSNFKIFYNGNWMDIVKTFGDNLVMPESEGDKYFEKYKEEYEKTKTITPEPKHLSPTETISTLFSALQSFFVSLTKNNLFAQTFDFNYLKKLNLSPDKLLDLLRLISQQSGLMSMCSKGEFTKIIKKTFLGSREQIIFRNIVFSPENQEIFPIFVRLDNNIFTSPNFIRLLAIYYYPIYYKSLFDAEISKRGNDFEKVEIPEKFKSMGFKVRPSILDKKKSTLEIDGLAWKGDVLHVIESKVWDIKSFFEHKKIHLYRERDLKGIVDGKSYTEGKPKDIPSLTEKVDYIKQNLAKYCPDFLNIKEVKGLIVTKSYPPIKEYKNIKILASEELNKLIS